MGTISSESGIGTPSSSTDNAIPRWDGTGGNALQDSGIIISDSNNITGVGGITMDGNLDLSATATNQLITGLGLANALSLDIGGNGDGFYSSSPGTVRGVIGGATIFVYNATGIQGTAVGRPLMRFNITCSNTAPTQIPYGVDTDTGWGGGGNNTLSGIVGGVEGLRISEANGEILHTFNGTEVENITDASTTGSAATLTKAAENFDVTCSVGDIVFVYGGTTAADFGTYIIKTVTSATVLTLDRNFSTSNTDVDFFVMSKSIAIENSRDSNATLILPAAMHMREISTPTAIDSFGAIYAKSDNKLYFQDGAGAEHELAFV